MLASALRCQRPCGPRDTFRVKTDDRGYIVLSKIRDGQQVLPAGRASGGWSVVREWEAVLQVGNFDTSVRVAVKSAKPSAEGQRQLKTEVRAHEYLLRQGFHGEVVPFLGLAMLEEGRLGIVMPVCELVRNNACLRGGRIIDFAKQLTEGLTRLSHCAFMHGDIKPDNLLVQIQEVKFRVFIADLGLSVWGGDLVKKRVDVHRRGTFPYRLAAWFTQEQRGIVVSRCKGIGLPDRFAALMTVVSVCTNLGLSSTKQGVRQANTRTAGSAYVASGQTCFVTWLFDHNMVCDGAVHKTYCKPLQLCRFRRELFGILSQFVNAVA